MRVGVQEFVGAAKYPLAIAGCKGGAGLGDRAQSQMGAIGGKLDGGLGEPVQQAEQMPRCSGPGADHQAAGSAATG